MSLFVENAEKISKLTDIPYNVLTPTRFGNDTAWQDANTYILASMLVPKEQGLLVFRTECYVTNLTNGATDFMQYAVPPPGNAWWAYANLSTLVPDNISDQTGRANPAHILLNVDNWLIFGYGPFVNLIGDLDAVADGDERQVRTTCYGFFVPGEIYERIRNQFEQPFGRFVV